MSKYYSFRLLPLALVASFAMPAFADADFKHPRHQSHSQAPLVIGHRGAQNGASFLAHDLFKSWGKLIRGGPYELVIADPPSFQKGSFVATKDYARLARRLPDLLVPGGHALLCLNAPELDTEFLHHQMREQAPELQFVQRLPNPAVFADIDPERALKVLVYHLPGGASGAPQP